MKIAILSTPWIAVPPVGYGGLERVVAHLTEGLVKNGHDVTLFATGDSQTSATLAYFYDKAIGNDAYSKQNPYLNLNHLYHFYKLVKEKGFDIIHNNDGREPLFFSDFINTPLVTTLHGTLTEADIQKEEYSWRGGPQLYEQFSTLPFVSISDTQRIGVPDLNYVETIYNSIVLSDFQFNETGGDDMVWLGRLTRIKGVDVGLSVAKKTKRKLHVAAFIDPAEKEYVAEKITPFEGTSYAAFHPQIQTEQVKSDYLGPAKLFLMPIVWDEPFGIVMIEAMATGTPVVAFAKGAAPEIVRDGETGFLVNFSETEKTGDYLIKKTGQAGLQEAIERVYSLSEGEYKAMRRRAREEVEKRFTVAVMVKAYENVFEKIMNTPR